MLRVHTCLPGPCSQPCTRRLLHPAGRQHASGCGSAPCTARAASAPAPCTAPADSVPRLRTPSRHLNSTGHKQASWVDCSLNHGLTEHRAIYSSGSISASSLQCSSSRNSPACAHTPVSSYLNTRIRCSEAFLNSMRPQKLCTVSSLTVVSLKLWAQLFAWLQHPRKRCI